jgi:ADP-ribose pyrophosphatase YjhB (NUDIX family)
MAQDTPELLKALGEINPNQPYGTELFDALARVTVSVAMEAVCLRFIAGAGGPPLIQVYLVQRAQNDTAYPGQWHCPGSVLRPGEEINDVFARLAKNEFGAGLKSWRFVANVNHPTEERGHFLSVVHLCELETAIGQRGKWFPVNNLPANTVETHTHRVIPVAVGAFVAEHTEVSA